MIHRAEAEESVAEEVESGLLAGRRSGGAQDSDASFLLRNAMVRLNAYERMRDALKELKMIGQPSVIKEVGDSDVIYVYHRYCSNSQINAIFIQIYSDYNKLFYKYFLYIRIYKFTYCISLTKIRYGLYMS